jgi:hypothetical protein
MAKYHNQRFFVNIALLVWVLVSILVLIHTLGFHSWNGQQRSTLNIQTGPYSNLSITLASVAVTWLLAGSLLILLAANQINKANVYTLAGFYLIALVYLNFLRERPEYGDIEYYIQAATNLYKSRPLPPEYLYPPLWASLLEPFIPLGERVIFIGVWLANLLSLFLFYFLLQHVLQRYGFSTRLAALTTTAFLLVNTPLLRTLVYMQVNLHTLNLVLLSLLLYQRAPFLSALSLALAVHLKVSPILLLPAFSLGRNWRWMIWFVLSLLVIVLATAAMDGFGPYLDFLRNAVLLSGPHQISYRDSSIDGFFAALSETFNISSGVTRLLVYASKLILTGFVIVVLLQILRRRALTSTPDMAPLHNSLPVLFILMTLSAPIVWEHHGIFLGLTFLLLLKRIQTPSEWIWFGTAYLLEFLLPTFDFFPWSYGRLIAPLIVLWLMWKTARSDKDGNWFVSANQFDILNAKA